MCLSHESHNLKMITVYGELAIQKLQVEVNECVVKCTQKDPEKLVDLSLNKAR